MASKKLESSLLEHTNYLRSLHLESPRIGNVFLEDQALIDYTSHIFGFKNEGAHNKPNKFKKFYD